MSVLTVQGKARALISLLPGIAIVASAMAQAPTGPATGGVNLGQLGVSDPNYGQLQGNLSALQGAFSNYAACANVTKTPQQLQLEGAIMGGTNMLGELLNGNSSLTGFASQDPSKCPRLETEKSCQDFMVGDGPFNVSAYNAYIKRLKSDFACYQRTYLGQIEELRLSKARIDCAMSSKKAVTDAITAMQTSLLALHSQAESNAELMDQVNEDYLEKGVSADKVLQGHDGQDGLAQLAAKKKEVDQYKIAAAGFPTSVQQLYSQARLFQQNTQRLKYSQVRECALGESPAAAAGIPGAVSAGCNAKTLPDVIACRVRDSVYRKYGGRDACEKNDGCKSLYTKATQRINDVISKTIGSKLPQIKSLADANGKSGGTIASFPALETAVDQAFSNTSQFGDLFKKQFPDLESFMPLGMKYGNSPNSVAALVLSVYAACDRSITIDQGPGSEYDTYLNGGQGQNGPIPGLVQQENAIKASMDQTLRDLEDMYKNVAGFTKSGPLPDLKLPDLSGSPLNNMGAREKAMSDYAANIKLAQAQLANAFEGREKDATGKPISSVIAIAGIAKPTTASGLAMPAGSCRGNPLASATDGYSDCVVCRGITDCQSKVAKYKDDLGRRTKSFQKTASEYKAGLNRQINQAISQAGKRIQPQVDGMIAQLRNIGSQLGPLGVSLGDDAFKRIDGEMLEPAEVKEPGIPPGIFKMPADPVKALASVMNLPTFIQDEKSFNDLKASIDKKDGEISDKLTEKNSDYTNAMKDLTPGLCREKAYAQLGKRMSGELKGASTGCAPYGEWCQQHRTDDPLAKLVEASRKLANLSSSVDVTELGDGFQSCEASAEAQTEYDNFVKAHPLTVAQNGDKDSAELNHRNLLDKERERLGLKEGKPKGGKGGYSCSSISSHASNFEKEAAKYKDIGKGFDAGSASK